MLKTSRIKSLQRKLAILRRQTAQVRNSLRNLRAEERSEPVRDADPRWPNLYRQG